MVANCRVKITMSFSVTPPPNPGMVMLPGLAAHHGGDDLLGPEPRHHGLSVGRLHLAGDGLAPPGCVPV